MSVPFEFAVSHAREARWDRGLRSFFEYRDLGVRSATGGRVAAHVIRAVPGTKAEPQPHHHELDFQMVYVLKGRVRFHYEGVGEVELEAGSCVVQPSGIRHVELEHSPDVELLEIVMPATFRTAND